ncbi:hypothetical protein QA645_07080 [Bradyrhizobium sp. CIAT3101]|uniref:hypothetical protein n=1 Tax=Bradyrhizobium sp. CIAT3101 TaxID=439387 RepID=UPI0024B1DB9B|nr:hypothetical protein [Bradyrhizobium sp. CIAT3101]WFU82501.1 hypothetical protein QA645_07080 [Bradyrhizobium sp. CIAT3101]
MSSLLWVLARENPLPGIAAASFNLMVALSLVSIGLLLAITISAMACLHALADRDSLSVQYAARRGPPLPLVRAARPS